MNRIFATNFVRLLPALAWAAACALPAQADPFPAITYAGTITHAVFVPENPFGVPIGPGTPFTLTIAPGAAGSPYRLLFAVQGQQFVAGQVTSTDTVDSPTGSDQMTIMANNGPPAQTRAAYAMEVILQGGSDALDSGVLPRFDHLTLRTFSLDATEHRGKAVYQYELVAQIRQEALPEPGMPALAGVGALAVLAARRCHAGRRPRAAS